MEKYSRNIGLAQCWILYLVEITAIYSKLTAERYVYSKLEEWFVEYRISVVFLLGTVLLFESERNNSLPKNITDITLLRCIRLNKLLKIVVAFNM